MTSPTGRPTRNKGGEGFTLIEIILVLGITAIIAALALPNFFQKHGSVRLRHISGDLVNKARWAQAMAMGQQCTYTLSFSNDRSSYRIMRGQEILTGAVGRRVALHEDIHLETQKDDLRFYPDGTLDAAEIKLLSGGRKIVLSSGVAPGALVVVEDEKE